MSGNLKIRQFDIREADWKLDGPVLSRLRRIVFIVEQSVPQEEEWDGRDESSWHWLAADVEGRPIGTARLLPEGQIGRMAVLQEHRGYGIGAALLESAVEKARRLGFERVFLNAQTHALAFYEKAGFVREGEEFMEAGIPHYRMKRALSLPDDAARRLLATGPAPDVAIQKFDLAEVPWSEQGKIIRTLRDAVFVRELGLPRTLVTDATDDSAIHWHARLMNGQIIGAIRMDLNGNIGRLAVSADFRHQGAGRTLVELAVAKAKRFGLAKVNAAALSELDRFYRSCGFEPQGETFEEYGLTHREYVKNLDDENIDAHTPTARLGDDDSSSNPVYRLGGDNKLILLRSEKEFRNVIVEMCKQATRSIRIFSPLLEHKLFDNSELKEICSALARRNKYTRVEMLIYDPHRMIKNGHALLDISRKLSSSISIRVVDPELRQLNHEYLLADDAGFIYRRDHEIFDGYANFNDVAECNELSRTFKAAWESGLLDANLRQLRI